MPKPLVVYDADCGFCTTSTMWLSKHGTFDIKAGQFIKDLESMGLNMAMIQEAAHWVVGGERVASGSDAIGKALIARGGPSRILGNIVLSPMVRPAARFVYKRIAKNRHRMPGGTAACKIPQ